jgi:HPt (histidine-containing phosphotransfer) domain-containing protein
MADDSHGITPAETADVLVDTRALDLLCAQLGDDTLLMRQLIHTYERELTVRLHACAAAARSGNFIGLVEVAHSLVGTGAQLGVVALTDAARRLERAGLDNDSAAAEAALARVVDYETGTRAALLSWVQTLGH